METPILIPPSLSDAYLVPAEVRSPGVAPVRDEDARELRDENGLIIREDK